MMEMWFATIAQSGGVSGGAGGFLIQMAPIAIIMGIMYFLIILPQNKKQKELENFRDSLTVGTRVVTQGGLVGKVHKIEKGLIMLDIGDRTRVGVMREYIIGPWNAEGADKAEASQEDAKAK